MLRKEIHSGKVKEEIVYSYYQNICSEVKVNHLPLHRFSSMSVERRPERYTLDQVTLIAKEVILRYGNHIPLLIAQGSQDTIMINTEIPPQLHERRFEIMTQAGKFLAKDVQLGQLEQVFFVSEGWMSKGGEEKEPIIPPSKDPERIEVLLISSIDIAKNDQFEMILYEMVRDEEGTLSGLSEVEGMKNKEGGQGESYILNAFIEGYRKETYQHN